MMDAIPKAVKYIAIGFFLMNLIGLDRSPIVWMDEVTLNDPAKELALNGNLISSVFSDRNSFGEAYYWQPPGQPLLMSLIYRLFGFGIWQTRLPGLFFASGILVMLYFLSMSLLRNHSSAIIAILILGLDPKFIESARSARMDTQSLLLAISGIYLVFSLRSIRDNNSNTYLPSMLFAGLCLGLAGITHPLAIVWVLSLALIKLLWKHSLPTQKFVWLLVAIVTPLSIWVLSAFGSGELKLLGDQFFDHGGSRLASGSLFGRISDEVLRYWDAYRLVPGLLLVYFGGIVWLFYNRRNLSYGSAWLCVLTILPILFNTFFMSKTVGFYYLYPVSMMALASGAMINHLWNNKTRIFSIFLPRVAVRGVLSALFISVIGFGILGRYVVLAYQWDQRDYAPIKLALERTIPPNSVIWGPPDIWYAAEEIGASLRIRGEPLRNNHDYLVTKLTGDIDIPTDLHLVAELGSALPPVFGTISVSSADYRMQVWQWDSN
jgi:4-amino-4-deoxy-L-arabinose transferase-like glycosyltransferase